MVGRRLPVKSVIPNSRMTIHKYNMPFRPLSAPKLHPALCDLKATCLSSVHSPESGPVERAHSTEASVTSKLVSWGPVTCGLLIDHRLDAVACMAHVVHNWRPICICASSTAIVSFLSPALLVQRA